MQLTEIAISVTVISLGALLVVLICEMVKALLKGIREGPFHAREEEAEGVQEGNKFL